MADEGGGFDCEFMRELVGVGSVGVDSDTGAGDRDETVKVLEFSKDGGGQIELDDVLRFILDLVNVLRGRGG